MLPLPAALELLRDSLTESALLHHFLGPLLLLLPLLGAGLLLLLRVACAGKGSRIGLALLVAVVPALFGYDLLLGAAARPPDPQTDPRALARLEANPAHGRYLDALGRHRVEARRLILPALLLAGLALIALPSEKPGKWLLAILVLAALAFAALALLLLQRKVRLDHPELPPGSPALDAFWGVAAEPASLP